MGFPSDFAWGAATAAYQIEGGSTADGRGVSVWDSYCDDGKVERGDSGLEACDHYHRWAEDVGLMAEIGLKAYRMSVAWPRIMPNGTGAVNEAGLAYYEQLVDALLAAGVTLWVTLFHWDYPRPLYLRGGWLNPDSPRWFADYAHTVVERLGDRVDHWLTINEPQCFLGLGHRTGEQAPGLKYGMSDASTVVHNTLLAHGHAVEAIRAASPRPAQVGAALVGKIAMPQTTAPADIEAARRATFGLHRPGIGGNTLYMDPMYRGCYPDDLAVAYDGMVPEIDADDLAVIHQPLDFFGTNIYFAEVVRASDAACGFEQVPGHTSIGYNILGWPVQPECLYWGPRLLHERYGLPVVITENGMAAHDWPSLDGAVHDPQRVDFLARHLGALGRAIDDGVTCAGYFHWSLMDNFEWSLGYRPRFGLVYVDYPSQRRIVKDSGRWYRECIASNGAVVADVGEPG
ncbi:MAG: GH1 family beta-glucosidase [Planctomycetota bacterium]